MPTWAAMLQEAEPLSRAPVGSYMLLGKVTPPVQSDNVNVYNSH